MCAPAAKSSTRQSARFCSWRTNPATLRRFSLQLVMFVKITEQGVHFRIVNSDPIFSTHRKNLEIRCEFGYIVMILMNNTPYPTLTESCKTTPCLCVGRKRGRGPRDDLRNKKCADNYYRFTYISVKDLVDIGFDSYAVGWVGLKYTAFWNMLMPANSRDKRVT